MTDLIRETIVYHLKRIHNRESKTGFWLWFWRYFVRWQSSHLLNVTQGPYNLILIHFPSVWLLVFIDSLVPASLNYSSFSEQILNFVYAFFFPFSISFPLFSSWKNNIHPSRSISNVTSSMKSSLTSNQVKLSFSLLFSQG